jgi:hypothetical protein
VTSEPDEVGRNNEVPMSINFDINSNIEQIQMKFQSGEFSKN